MPKPIQGTYPAYFDNYIGLVNETDLKKAFKNQQEIVDKFLPSISEEKANHAYAPGKWTLKELLQHVIDTERIFGYRSLAFARKEAASLSSFDENVYAENSNANARTWKSLCAEMKAVRKATRLLFRSFNSKMLKSTGMANNNPMSVNAMGYTTVGHLYHHKKIIETKYM